MCYNEEGIKTTSTPRKVCMFYKLSSLKSYERKFERFHSNTPKPNEIELFNSLQKGIEEIESHLNLHPFDEQIIGAFVLASGAIAEMKTGEGKTLTAALAAIMTAKEGQVMIVTVNDYLAKRDYELLRPVYEACGFSVGLVTHAQTPYRKKDAYTKDIVYVTNAELGFDFLRDNTATSLEARVITRPLHRAIIDEVDAILIDDARTPLILSGKGTADVSDARYKQADATVASLKDSYIKKNAKTRTVTLTEAGHDFVQNKLGKHNLYATDNVLTAHLINNALKARFMERENIEYLIKRGKIELIDKMGGRVMDGRRYNDGLMQAIEAKERLDIQDETKTLASITYQNLARLFKHISGMTGTAHSEAREFKELYNLEVIQIPTHEPLVRLDHEDKLFDTQRDANTYLLRLVDKAIAQGGQPLLIAADSTRRAEALSRLFTEEKIVHSLLTARDASKEAQVIREAGRTGSILITTALAGRGTDIKLLDENAKRLGLFVIGVGRGQSKRVDDQLRGRAGRQGDLGQSIFLVSKEDDLYNVLDNPQLTRSGEIKWSLYTPDYVQKMIEAKDYDSRKNTLEYDDVLREQREVIYQLRNSILENKDLQDVATTAREFAKRAYADDKQLEALEHALNGTLTPKRFRAIQLQILDDNWSDYMKELDYIKDTMSYRSYAGRNPLIDFQQEASKYFSEFLDNTRKDILEALITIGNIKTKPRRLPKKNTSMRQFTKEKFK